MNYKLNLIVWTQYSYKFITLYFQFHQNFLSDTFNNTKGFRL